MTERYHPSRDQVTLAAGLGGSLASLLPLSRLRQSQEESAVTWKALRDLGVFDISTPEEQGGSGLGIIEEALISIELGRRVVAPSVLATIGALRLPFAGERRVTVLQLAFDALQHRALPATQHRNLDPPGLSGDLVRYPTDPCRTHPPPWAP